MKELSQILLEKLRINKNSKIITRNPEDFWDARTFRKDDILYIHPNIIRGPNKPARGGEPEFFKVVNNDGKKLKLTLLNNAYVHLDKNFKNGIVKPSTERDITISTNIHNDGFAYYSGLVLYLYDDEPLEFWK